MALIGRVVRSRCSSTINARILLSRESSITIPARVCKHSAWASERLSLRCSPTLSSRLWSIQPNAGPVLIGTPFCSSRGLTARLFMLPYSCRLHTSSTTLKDTDSKPAGQGSKGHEHGSVLMQFVGKKEEPKQLTVGAKVVQAGKDFTYILVILGGFALTGFLFWMVGSEFFFSTSPSSVFTKALKKVKNDPRVIEVLGEPIAGHGDTSGRGRRRHLAHQEYIVEGMTYMRMKFYVSGSKRKGTVYLDLKKNDQGKYECRFLFVELQGYPAGTIVIEDNR